MRTKKVLFLLLLLVFISFATGCLGSLFNNKPIIESTPGATAKVGMVYTYTIIATDPDADDVLTYSLTENPTGMTINTSTGAVSWTPTKLQVGEKQVIIEVSDGKVSVSQNFTITVTEALLDHIVVVPSEMSVPIGSSETITSITAHYENGTTAAIELDSTDVSYDLDSSDTPDIITVNASGEVTGVAAGTATITVSYTEGEITVDATIDVTVPPVLILISVQPEFMIIYEGSSQSITSITAYYENGTNADIELDSTDVSYDLDSPDTPDIISVNTSGLVTGESVGSAVITVSYTEGGITMADTVYITVEEEPVILVSLTVIPSTMEIAVGDIGNIIDIVAAYSDAPHTVLIALASVDVDYSSSNIGVATVDTGVVTAVAVGTATITVSYTEGVITETDTVAVTVIE
jgi:uncharacterized protein YjdB